MLNAVEDTRVASMSDIVAATSTSSAPRSEAVFTNVRWALSGVWALLDQGLFALANFSVNIVLARWLTPEDYGGFTVAYAIFLLVGTAHTALLAEPMLVFSTGLYSQRLPDYLAVLERGHWFLTAVASAVLAVLGAGLLVLGQQAVGQAVLTLAVVTPLMLQLWLTRRICHVRNKPHLAVSGGLLYIGFLGGGAYLLVDRSWVSSPAAFLLMGIGSACAVLWIRSQAPAEASVRSPQFRREVVARHWEYGRWAVGTGMLGAVVWNLYYVAMPLRFGLEGTATLKALMNFIMPAFQSITALWVVALPRFVRVRNTCAFRPLIRKLLIVCCSGALLNWLALGLLHRYLVSWLYNGAYAEESDWLWILGLVPVAFTTVAVLENALRSLERPDEVFRAYVMWAAVTFVVGLPLMLAWGAGGAIVGLLTSTIVAACVMGWSLRTRRGQRGGSR